MDRPAPNGRDISKRGPPSSDGPFKIRGFVTMFAWVGIIMIARGKAEKKDRLVNGPRASQPGTELCARWLTMKTSREIVDLPMKARRLNPAP